jgi:hypothetical protein
MREELAELCHSQWSGWIDYMFAQGVLMTDGSWLMPKEYVDRWKRQSGTPYEDLSAIEKESDRREADKFIDLLKSTNSEYTIAQVVEKVLEQHGFSSSLVGENKSASSTQFSVTHNEVEVQKAWSSPWNEISEYERGTVAAIGVIAQIADDKLSEKERHATITDDVIKDWIDALRSGKYTQGMEVLKSSSGCKELHCCLGVLIEVIDPDRFDKTEIDDGAKCFYYEEDHQMIPEWMSRQIDLLTRSDASTLSRLNDSGSTFIDIAELLEDGLLGRPKSDKKILESLIVETKKYKDQVKSSSLSSGVAFLKSLCLGKRWVVGSEDIRGIVMRVKLGRV